MNTVVSAAGGVLLLLATIAKGAEALPPLDFVPPAPGSYRLERIMPAPDGAVVDVHNQPRRLSAFTTGWITLLSFIYTSCSDAWGCPLAYAVMDNLKQAIEREPRVAQQLRFVSLSFDPERDTPSVMKAYAGSHASDNGRLPWYFLTTESPRQLRPLLDGFGQDLSIVLDDEGRPTGMLTHVLKVFLIDRTGSVREIYSTSYLQPRVVLNDIKTLLLEEGAPTN